MARIGHDSKAQSIHNEDFYYSKDLSDGHLLVVGDFAQSTVTGLHKLATKELDALLDDYDLATLPRPFFLAHFANQFNARLLAYRSGYNATFQCCAVFAFLADTTFEYLSVGDCRVSIFRGERLLLLNGSVWVDSGGNQLPLVITDQQQVRRGHENPPPQVLGVAPVDLSPALVVEFPLQVDDLVLLYSDGVDKTLSPTHFLRVLRAVPVGEPPQSIVSRVLAEVELSHADDDRTLLVAAGPHRAIQSQSQSEERDRALHLQREVGDIKRVLDERLANLENVVAETNSLDATLKVIYQLIQTLPTLSSIRQELIAVNEQRGTFDRDLHEKLQAITEQLTRIESDLQRSQKGGGSFRSDADSLNDAIYEEMRTLKTLIVEGTAAAQAAQEVGANMPSLLAGVEGRIKAMLPKSDEDEAVPQAERPKWEILKSWTARENRIGLIVIAVFFFLGVLGGALLNKYLLTFGDSRQQPATPRTSVATSTGSPDSRGDSPVYPWRITYGPEGRTLYVSDGKTEKPLDVRIQTGQEITFHQLISKQAFPSEEEARSWIKSVDRKFIISRIVPVKANERNQRTFSVQPPDLTGEPCDSFLARLRQSGAQGDVAALQSLNPGLRCRELRVGDQLLVYVGNRL